MSVLGRWFLRSFSLSLWGKLSARFQRAASRTYASLYEQRWTRHLIPPYCKFNGMAQDYLSQFEPASGNSEYQSFQDFFTRKYKEELRPDEKRIWPCEGLLCDHGWFGRMDPVKVKGHLRDPKVIFGALGEEIPNGYYFANIFLNNNDYHRIHSPIDGEVRRIEHRKGELIVLRPWIYPQNPSLPAFRNERVNVKLLEKRSERPWFISIVGGPAVAGIRLKEKVEQKGELQCGEEMGTFLLGSTLCIGVPLDQEGGALGSRVKPGLPLGAS